MRLLGEGRIKMPYLFYTVTAVASEAEYAERKQSSDLNVSTLADEFVEMCCRPNVVQCLVLY